jgi:pyridoxine 5-phosphate synthase
MNISPATLSDIPQLCDLLELLFSEEAEFRIGLNATSSALFRQQSVIWAACTLNVSREENRRKTELTKLSVNLNKVALLRNARNIGIPSVTKAAQICISAGAHGITVHPRPDERHAKPSDVFDLASLLATASGVELNVEGNPFPQFMEIVRNVKPTQCTLVPDSPDALTSDHGWDLAEHGSRLRTIIDELKSLGIRISLFLDPDCEQVERAKEFGADRIELYTETYAANYNTTNADTVFEQFARASRKAHEIGLGVNAGHDLNLENLGKFCSILNIAEVSIGHALVSDALEMGMHSAVQAYLKVLEECTHAVHQGRST